VIEVPIREFINWEKTKRALTEIGNVEVRRVMSSPVVAIDEDAEIADAAAQMLHEGIARLPVLRDAKLVGIVTVPISSGPRYVSRRGKRHEGICGVEGVSAWGIKEGSSGSP
jgi:hypothetical protein